MILENCESVAVDPAKEPTGIVLVIHTLITGYMFTYLSPKISSRSEQSRPS